MRISSLSVLVLCLHLLSYHARSDSLSISVSVGEFGQNLNGESYSEDSTLDAFLCRRRSVRIRHVVSHSMGRKALHSLEPSLYGHCSGGAHEFCRKRLRICVDLLMLTRGRHTGASCKEVISDIDLFMVFSTSWCTRLEEHKKPHVHAVEIEGSSRRSQIKPRKCSSCAFSWYCILIFLCYFTMRPPT